MTIPITEITTKGNQLKRVYTAGPIAGLSYTEARHGWREQIAGMLDGSISVYSPMRFKDVLKDELSFHPHGYEWPIATNKGIVTRDRMDVSKADLMIVNLTGAKTVSIGTMVEFGWADANRVPIITIMEQSGNIHDHAFIRELSGYIVETLEEAAFIANAILNPGV